MIYSRTLKFLNYNILSRHWRGHGIHSPFVFDLVSRVFRKKTDQSVVIKVERIREMMLSDKRTISVTDLGTGSASLKTKNRKVSEIAKHSPVSGKYGKLLSNLAAEFGDKMILELGTSLGISAMYMAASRPDSTVYTIEGSPEIAAIARQNFAAADLSNINLLEGSFDDILQVLKLEGVKPGLVFIDGNHRKKALLKYFNIIAEFSDPNTVVIVDDINYSQEMNEAWNVLKQHTKVSIAIDLFQMGILIFREGISRNDYTIRY